MERRVYLIFLDAHTDNPVRWIASPDFQEIGTLCRFLVDKCDVNRFEIVRVCSKGITSMTLTDFAKTFGIIKRNTEEEIENSERICFGEDLFIQNARLFCK